MKLVVLALSYSLVLMVNPLIGGLTHYAYYLIAALTCFVIFILCVGNKSKLINGYAYVQLLAMITYVIMITPSGFYFVDAFMYGGVINYANVILMYEIIMLVTGLKDGYNAIYRYFNDSDMYSYRTFRG